MARAMLKVGFKFFCFFLFLKSKVSYALSWFMLIGINRFAGIMLV